MSDSFRDYALEQLGPGVECRAMFGGHGLYHGGAFFGILHRGRFCLKTSPRTRKDFAARGMKPYRSKYGCAPVGTYSTAVDDKGETLYVTWNVKGRLKAGASYLFRFYVRTENFTRDGKPADFKFGIDRTGKGGASETKYHFEAPGSEGAWAARRVTFEATGPDLWFAFYTGAAGGAYGGTMWFDDFYLAEIPSPPAKGK